MKFHSNTVAVKVLNLLSGHEIAKLLQNMQIGVKVLVHDTSSHCALQLYDVSTK